jgi:hypoxanthine phosphoribosyltransferase
MLKLPENSELLFSAKDVDLMVEKIAKEISTDFSASSTPPLFIGVLNGAYVFMADLLRELEFPVHVDFIRASSYGSASKSSGEVKVESFNPLKVEGKDLYLVDEIIDTGRTLEDLKKYFLSSGAKSVKSVVLLDKKCRREVEVDPDYVGIEIPDYFVVGYGLDWAEKYRDLPDIHIIKDA